MGYKISDTLDTTARIIVVNESDWTVEYSELVESGVYEILVSNSKKIILARTSDGKSIGFGNIDPTVALGNRGVFGGGANAWEGITDYNVMDYIDISTNGNAQDFGDLTLARSIISATSNGSSDRGVFGGGSAGDIRGVDNIIDYITISTTGDAQDFGDLTFARYGAAATSNNTGDRGVFGGGFYSGTFHDLIDYITISTTGAAQDFGNLTAITMRSSATSNATNNRGVFGGNYSELNIIQYITISTLGDAAGFGDLTVGRNDLDAVSNGTSDRGVFGGGYTWFAHNVLDYITISSTGNAQDFGDLTTNAIGPGACSNNTGNKGVFAGGRDSTTTNVMAYITISNAGNAQDFGDLTIPRFRLTGLSDA